MSIHYYADGTPCECDKMEIGYFYASVIFL